MKCVTNVIPGQPADLEKPRYQLYYRCPFNYIVDRQFPKRKAIVLGIDGVEVSSLTNEKVMKDGYPLNPGTVIKIKLEQE